MATAKQAETKPKTVPKSQPKTAAKSKPHPKKTVASKAKPKAAPKTKNATKPKRVIKGTAKGAKRRQSGPFTNPALTRIARKAGIKSITPKACLYLRQETESFLKETVEQAKLHQENISKGRKTLMREDVDIVLYERGIVLANSLQRKLTKHKFKTFERYVVQVSKMHHPNFQITKDAQGQLNSFIYELAHRIVHAARKAAHQNDKITTSLKHITYAIGIILGGKLGDKALKEVSDSIRKYKDSILDKSAKKKMTDRTGLAIPPSRMTQFFKSSKRTSLFARIALAASVETVLAALLDQASIVAKESKRTRILPKHLKTSVSKDDDLKGLFCRLKFKFVRVPTTDIQIRDMKRDNATRQMRKQQRSNANAMRRMPFDRLVKQYVGSDLRVSAGAVNELMDYVELTLYKILELSKNLADHAKRSRVGDVDVELAFKTLRYTC